MTLAMPIGKVKLPTVIKSQDNGAVDPDLLSWIEEYRKGSTDLRFKMADLAARSMRAWHAHLAVTYKLDIRTTGRYRDLPGQWNIFGGASARYRPVSLAEYNAAASTNRKQWPLNDYTASTGQPAPGRATCARLLGVTIPDSTYWVKPSTLAMAAVPGTSNHGFGCADDLQEFLNGVGLTSIRTSTLQILYATGHLFGFVWSTTTETWHVDWANGDVLTPATIAYESGPTPPVPTPTPTPVDSDLVITIYKLTDADAQFIALTTKAGVALHVEWTGPGDNPDVVDRINTHIALGAQVVTVAAADIKRCVLDGPLPQGDNKKVWTKADFFQPIK